MRNQRIKFLAPLAAVLVAGGCLDNSLALDNPNSATEQSYWAIPADALSGLNAVYRTLLNDGTFGRNRYWVTDHRTDCCLSRSPASNILNFSKSVVASYNEGFMTGMWNDVYRGIFRANLVINNVPKIAPTTAWPEATKQRYIAEAKFIRGLYYYETALIFGNGPILTEAVETGQTPAWHTTAEIYAQALKDATEAAAVLPLNYTGAEIGRVTRGAANMLIADIHMAQKNWAAAETALKAVIDSGRYSLLPGIAGYTNLFRFPEGENTVESIFEIQFGPAAMATLGARGNQNPRLVGPSTGFRPTGTQANQVQIGFNDSQPTDWAFAQFFSECAVAAGCYFNETTNTTNSPNPTVTIRGAGYPTKPDPRLDVSIFWAKPGGMDVFGTAFAVRYRTGGPPIIGAPAGTDFPGFKDTDLTHTYFFKKYQEYWKTTAPGLTDFHNEVNVKYYRYGHTLMYMAEVLNELNRPAEAVTYVNQIRARVGLPAVATVLGHAPSQAEMRQWIDREQLLEMFWEQKRLAFLRRQGIYTKELMAPRNPIGFSLFVNGKSDILPIPQSEIDTNCGIVGQVGCAGIVAKQNPGY